MEELTQVDINLMRLKRLKFITYDNYTDKDIKLLEEMWIINWVWPDHYWRLFRWLCTWLFDFLDYKRHDINFWKQTWFHEANYWILKYSYLSLADEYRKICEEKWSKRWYKVFKYHLTLGFKTRIITLAYNAVESKAWLKAYNNS